MDAARSQKVIALHQPVYLPFAGFFRKMALADEFAFLDFVQLSKQSWQVRNRIKTREGPLWLTVPAYVKGKHEQLIRDVRVAEGPWRRKHRDAIRQSYARAPYFADYADFVDDVYGREWEWLVDLNLYIIDGLRRFLGVETPVVDIGGMEFTGTKTDLVVGICKKMEGTAYLSSDGEAAYIEKEKFEAAGLRHGYLRWEPTPYPQLFGDFEPNLSAIDLLFNCGPGSRDVVLGNPPNEP
jgi:hypothetical protein